MKKRHIFIIIILILTCICSVIYAKYILTQDLTPINISTAPFYFSFDSTVDNPEIELSENKAELDFIVKNNDGSDHNMYETSYEISLIDDEEKFTFAVNGVSATDNLLSTTIDGDDLIDQTTKITFTPKNNVILNITEDIELKITSTYPYKKEINIPITLCVPNVSLSFASKEEYQTFIAPTDGVYKIELWGAQGGSGSADEVNYIYPGGLGSYTSGTISLKENTELYVYIGEKGADHAYNSEALSATSFNGGGAGGYDTNTDNTSDGGGSGGGATDIRLEKGTWSESSSLNSRIMVAAGGGGGAWPSEQTYEGQNGGGLYVKGLSIHGYRKDITVTDGTQTSGYSFGIGIDGLAGLATASKGGGGGGYWTGIVNDADNIAQGPGGTSYISGHNGCDAIDEASTEGNIIHTGQSVHYSGYQFTNTTMIDGTGYSWTTQRGSNVGMPTHDGTSTMVGNTGDGYAKITFLGKE